MSGLVPPIDASAVDAAGAALGRRLEALGMKVVSAESCTGGLIARALTETGGSSAWFERGHVTYSNASKQEVLGVASATIEAHGAVSEAVARDMALGALRRSQAQLALAVTGIAGPGGATPGKPVGTVCFGWAMTPPGSIDGLPLAWAQTVRFDGDRSAVRCQAALYALLEAGRRLEAELADRPPTA
jgi:nicotinamide-nucleotide amidase